MDVNLRAQAALLLLLVISSACAAGDAFSLGLKVEEFTAALIDNRPRDIYQLFVPAFRDEVSFSRFESSYVRWLAGRRPAKARPKVIGISGLGGHVSTYIVFSGEEEHTYVYQAWLNDNGIWRLVWLSGILESRVQYGSQDLSHSGVIVAAALEHLFSAAAPSFLWRELSLPETVLIVYDSVRLTVNAAAGRPVVWVTPLELSRREAPATNLVCAVPMVRVFGDVALVAVDFLEKGHARTFTRRRSVQVYLERSDSGWRFRSMGKVF
ncbi:MAG: hypothetical protein ABIK43_03390 [candidate division WOR-3 bacterium]